MKTQWSNKDNPINKILLDFIKDYEKNPPKKKKRKGRKNKK